MRNGVILLLLLLILGCTKQPEPPKVKSEPNRKSYWESLTEEERQEYLEIYDEVNPIEKGFRTY